MRDAQGAARAGHGGARDLPTPSAGPSGLGPPGGRPYNGGVTADAPEIVLYSRPGCSLCEEARATLAILLADRAARGLPAPSLAERSIEDDEALHRRYLTAIPVVAVGGRELELATGLSRLRRFLAEALDGAPAGRAAAELPGAPGEPDASGPIGPGAVGPGSTATGARGA